MRKKDFVNRFKLVRAIGAFRSYIHLLKQYKIQTIKRLQFIGYLGPIAVEVFPARAGSYGRRHRKSLSDCPVRHNQCSR